MGVVIRVTLSHADDPRPTVTSQPIIVETACFNAALCPLLSKDLIRA
jgi:hypothetical protein